MKTILCLDIGNTHIFGGVFVGNKISFHFRYSTKQGLTSDQFGLFLKNIFNEYKIVTNSIDDVCIGSVVPSANYSINAACIKYLNLRPLKVHPGLKTGLKLELKNPLEMGSDRIANAVGALHKFPDRDLIIIDFGTATTIDQVSSEYKYLGGAILPGVQTSMVALSEVAAKLSPVGILKPHDLFGKSTEAQIQIGIYYGHLGGIKTLVKKFAKNFKTKPLLIATGGYAPLFADENLFEINIIDLVLQGLRIILEKNRGSVNKDDQ